MINPQPYDIPELPDGWGWTVWTRGELDEVPTETWEFICQGHYSVSAARALPVWTAERGADAARELQHKATPLGRMRHDRDGKVTLVPHFRESMIVDPVFRTVTFACRRCTFRHSVQIDALVVVLTQTYTRSARFAEGDFIGLVRYPKRLINVWETFSLEPSLDADEDPEATAQKREVFPLLLRIYDTIKQPVAVEDRTGAAIMEVP